MERGGHNPLEPAAHAIPVLMGPHTFNFKDICAKLQQADGLITVTDADSVVKEVSTLLTDEDYRLWYGRHAVEVLHQNRGRTDPSAATSATLSAAAEPLMSTRLSVVMIAKNAADLLPDCLGLCCLGLTKSSFSTPEVRTIRRTLPVQPGQKSLPTPTGRATVFSVSVRRVTPRAITC